jgi:hypothetical protein
MSVQGRLPGVRMGIVLWHTSIPIDGFIAGPGDDMDWVFEDSQRPARTPKGPSKRRARSLPDAEPTKLDDATTSMV